MFVLPQIGQRISSARKHLGLSQARLAIESGSSRATVDALENGRLGEIGVSKLSNILSVLGLEMRVHEAVSPRPTLDQLLAENADDPDLVR